MKIYTNQADNFIKNIKAGSPGAILIYGPDTGAVQNFRKKIVDKVIAQPDAMAVKEFSSEQIKQDPAALLDEINARSFFATERVIVIDFAASIADVVMDAINALPSDLTVIITADELGKESKLRKLFEAHKTLPVIPCYKEDERAIRTAIFQKFRENQVNVDSDAMNYLVTNLGEDKQVTLNEIEKIITYLGDQKTLNYEEVTSLLADGSDLALGDIANSVAVRDTRGLEKSLARAYAEHMNAVPILRTVQWQVQRLLSARVMIENGMNIDAVLGSLRPQIFPRQAEEFKAALRKWNVRQLKAALETITRAEYEAKSSSIDPDITCRHALLKLAAGF